MSYTTTQLITNAWYLSGIVGRDLETVSGNQLNDGLEMLNAVLSAKSVNNRLIPYYTTLQTFNAVVGQQTYYKENLISVDALTFNIGSVRFPMQEVSRDIYFGAPKVDDITSLPFSYHVERAKGGADIFLYFLPEQPYLMTLTGKYAFVDAELGQDLSEIYDTFYIDYLRYALAEYMCCEYNIVFQPQALKRLREYEQSLIDVSPIDMTIRKVSTLSGSYGLTWADINFGKGWRPI